MKLAGFIALALAVVLAIWAGTDYAQNQQDMRYNSEKLKAEISRFDTSNSSLDERKEIESAERYDAIIGIVATCVLIGSVVLFAKSGRG